MYMKSYIITGLFHMKYIYDLIHMKASMIPMYMKSYVISYKNETKHVIIMIS